VVVVDGYVWLDGASVAGLGAHLYQALAGKVAVIGVAKTRFAGAGAAVEVIRRRSTRPLFITAVGMSAQEAAEHVLSMRGPNRIPVLLRRVDSLCRQRGQMIGFQNQPREPACVLPANSATSERKSRADNIILVVKGSIRDGDLDAYANRQAQPLENWNPTDEQARGYEKLV